MVGAVTIVAGYANRERLAIKIRSVYAPVTPKPVSPIAQGTRASRAFTGDAPWALSALPECFSQVSRTTGPRRFVLAHMPKGLHPVLGFASIASADCLLWVKADEVWVKRGADLMRVPPPAKLFQNGHTIALLRGAGGGYDLRVYYMAGVEQHTI